MLTISQTAKLLDVDKKTLMRWDTEGQFPAKREKISNIRYYNDEDIHNHVLWFEIRRKHKAHLKLLHDVRKEVDRFIRTSPLNPMENPKLFLLADIKKAYEALHKWEAEDRAISHEYSKLPEGFTPKIDPEY